MGVISQVLGKPQLEEEEKLMGLVDYRDGSHSSDAKLDTRAEEGVLDVSDPLSTEVKPRILHTGLRRSGKSSIQKVVFHKMFPRETLFLESTNKICRDHQVGPCPCLNGKAVAELRPERRQSSLTYSRCLLLHGK